MFKYTTFLAITLTTPLSACNNSIDLMDGHAECPTQTAYTEGLNLLKAKLRYPAGSKFPTFKESKPSELEKCEFNWYFDADIQNGFGALRRKKVSLTFHYDLVAKEWVAGSMWTR